MPTTLKAAVMNYLRAGTPAQGTRAEYHTTLTKWKEWGCGVPIERLGRKEIREFLDWVYERAVTLWKPVRIPTNPQTQPANTCGRSSAAQFREFLS